MAQTFGASAPETFEVPYWVVLFLLTALEVNVVRWSPQNVSIDILRRCEIPNFLLLIQFQLKYVRVNSTFSNNWSFALARFPLLL
jgi:hypothetical protein